MAPVVSRVGCREMRARADPVDLFGLIQLFGFVKTPGGMIIFRVGPALGARLHCYFDCAL